MGTLHHSANNTWQGTLQYRKHQVLRNTEEHITITIQFLNNIYPLQYHFLHPKQRTMLYTIRHLASHTIQVRQWRRRRRLVTTGGTGPDEAWRLRGISGGVSKSMAEGGNQGEEEWWPAACWQKSSLLTGFPKRASNGREKRAAPSPRMAVLVTVGAKREKAHYKEVKQKRRGEGRRKRKR